MLPEAIPAKLDEKRVASFGRNFLAMNDSNFNVLERLSYSDEVVGIERGATNQSAVDIGVGEEFFSVRRFAAAAVENGGFLSHFVTIFFGNEAADKGVHFLSLVGGGGAAGTDGPYWFVGNYDVGKIDGREVEEAVGDLALNHFELFVGFAFFEHFATANDGAYVLCEQLVDLGGYNGVGLVIISAAFGVPNNAVVNQFERAKNFCAHFASEGTTCLVAHVLCTNSKVGIVGIVGAHFKVWEWWANYKLDVATEVYLLKVVHDFGHQFIGVFKCFVHLPVAGYNFFSHGGMGFRVVNYFLVV